MVVEMIAFNEDNSRTYDNTLESVSRIIEFIKSNLGNDDRILDVIRHKDESLSIALRKENQTIWLAFNTNTIIGYINNVFITWKYSKRERISILEKKPIFQEDY